MPLPFIPIIAALAAGGSLVPHAAGGMIVSNAAGYIAGTYLSTAALSGVLVTASTTLGAGALYLSGAAATIIGGAGIFGTTVGASRITGMLMTAGLVASTPIWLPVAAGIAIAFAAIVCGYGVYRLIKLKRKINDTPAGEEALFSASDAKVIEKIIKLVDKKNNSANNNKPKLPSPAD